MRLRKVKNAEEILNNSQDICIEKPVELKGRWSFVFPSDGPIYLEIGSGKGQFISLSASLNPNINYIGMEKMTSVIVRAIEKVKALNLLNCMLLCKDGQDVCDYFSEGEIDRIYLNFSDPWPKNRHEKRRLTSMPFLKKFKTILKKDGLLIFKTDNYDFYLYSLLNLKEELNEDMKYGEMKEKEEASSEFEDKFRKLEKPIYFISGSFRR
ncbi:MAG: tRNA (guanosine(46)-N7)-methyltransferase TrmB [Bacillales bacterium]|nr:tRNA (guanosine(46)-N7)-methyltransferase TrmB [Bacillales bacterium]